MIQVPSKLGDCLVKNNPLDLLLNFKKDDFISHKLCFVKTK